MSQYPGGWQDNTGKPSSSQQRGTNFRPSFVNIRPDELVPPPPPSIAAALARHQQQKPTSRQHEEPYESRSRDYESTAARSYNKPESAVNEDRIFQELYFLKKETSRLTQELQAMKQEQQANEETQNLRKDVSSLQTEIQTLFAGMSEVSSTEDRVQKALEKYYEKYDSLKSDVKGIDKENRHVKEVMKGLERDVKNMKADLKAFNAIFGDFSELEMKFEKYKGIEAKISAIPKLAEELDNFHLAKVQILAIFERMQQYAELEKRLGKYVSLERRLSDFGPLDEFSKILVKIEDTLLKKIGKVERDVGRMEPFEKVHRTMKGVEDYLVKMLEKTERKLVDKIEYATQKSRQAEKQVSIVEAMVESLKRKAPEIPVEEPKSKVQKTTEQVEVAVKTEPKANVEPKAKTEPKVTFVTRTFSFEVLSEKEMKISGSFEGKTKAVTARIGDVYYAEYLLDCFVDDRLKQLNHIIVEFATSKQEGKAVERFSRAWFGKRPKSIRARDIEPGKMHRSLGILVVDGQNANVHVIYENAPLWFELKPEQLKVDDSVYSDFTKLNRGDYAAIEYSFEIDEDKKLQLKGASLSTKNLLAAGDSKLQATPEKRIVTSTLADSTSHHSEVSEFNPNEMIVLDSVYDAEHTETSNDSPTHQNDGSEIRTVEMKPKEELDIPAKSTRRSIKASSSPTLDSGPKWRPKRLNKSGDVFHAFANLPKKLEDPEDLKKIMPDAPVRPIPKLDSKIQIINPLALEDLTPKLKLVESAVTVQDDKKSADNTMEVCTILQPAQSPLQTSTVVAEEKLIEILDEHTSDDMTIVEPSPFKIPALPPLRTGTPTVVADEKLSKILHEHTSDDVMVVEERPCKIPVEHRSKETILEKETASRIQDEQISNRTMEETRSEISADEMEVDVALELVPDSPEKVEPAKVLLSDEDEETITATAIQDKATKLAPGAEDNEPSAALVHAEKEETVQEYITESAVRPKDDGETPMESGDVSISDGEQPAQSEDQNLVDEEQNMTIGVEMAEVEAVLEPNVDTADVENVEPCKNAQDSSSEQGNIISDMETPQVTEEKMDEHIEEQTSPVAEEKDLEGNLTSVKVQKDSPTPVNVSEPSKLAEAESSDIVPDEVVLALAKAADEMTQGFNVVDEVKEEDSPIPPNDCNRLEVRVKAEVSDDGGSLIDSSTDELKARREPEQLLGAKMDIDADGNPRSVNLADGRTIEVPLGFYFKGQTALENTNVIARLADVKLEGGSNIFELLGVYNGFNKDSCPYRKTPLISADEIGDEETVFVVIKSLSVKGKNGLFLTGKHRGVLVHIPKTALCGRAQNDILRADVTLKPNGVFSFESVSHMPVVKD